MEKVTVAKTTEYGLCTSCGLCAGICPAGSISYVRRDGLYLPQIHPERCISCGLCARVCPGLGHGYAPAETAEEAVTGQVLASYSAWSREKAVRHGSASGGVVTTLIRTLLETGRYDGAFCVDSYDYRQQLQTRLFTAGEDLMASGTPKSRYLPVSHEKAAAYLKDHRDARLIFVGTSCAVRGLQKVVDTLKLDRAQYLFVGLFCDKVFNYNVLQWFSDSCAGGKPLKALHFKNKESGGWPGDMKLFPEEGEPFYVPKEKRAAAKDWFMPERCLYCVDKLNCTADISLGDNYTGKDDSPLGTNSVLVRTAAGAEALEAAREQLELRPARIEEIQRAQYLSGRLENLYYARLKAREMGPDADLNRGISPAGDIWDYGPARRDARKRLQAGACYDRDPKRLEKQLGKAARKISAPALLLLRCRNFLMRKWKRG